MLEKIIKIGLLIFCLISFQVEKVFSSTLPQKVQNFALLDQAGKFHELHYYSDQKAVVLISQGNGCPIVRQSISYLNKLKSIYEPKGVVFLMINANAQDDRDAIAREASEFHFNISVLDDQAQMVSAALEIKRTAEAIVIDPVEWKIIYRGPIHDGFGYETKKKEPQYFYLRNALDAHLAGRSVDISAMPVKGCLIHFDQKSTASKIAYTKDAAPILINHCVLCHSPGGVAPWSMDRYEQVKGWGPMIREVVMTKRMPPWKADPRYGVFKNDFSLSSDDVQMLVRWVEQGMPRGEGDDPLLSTPRPQFKDWTLGLPDLIFSLKEEQNIPSTGVLDYRILPVDEPVKEDLWVRAFDMRPGNLKAVHHADVTVALPNETLFAANSENASQEESQWYIHSGLKVDGVGQVIAGYAPGYDSLFVLPEDSGMFIPKGSTLTFWMHYITTGKEEKDFTRLGVYLHKKKPARVYSVAHITNTSFKIPAGAKDFPVSAEYVFPNEVLLWTLVPHMHYRGQSMKFTAIYPDGRLEILLSVPHFKFAWQYRYLFKEPKRIPAGTKILLEGAFDNSAQNPDNPDPSKEVTFGPQSFDEMFSGFLFYTTLP